MKYRGTAYAGVCFYIQNMQKKCLNQSWWNLLKIHEESDTNLSVDAFTNRQIY